MAKTEKTLSFKEALAALEKTAQTIKREDITLEEAMKAYEEGVKLYKTCDEILSEAKGKITVLKETAQGEL